MTLTEPLGLSEGGLCLMGFHHIFCLSFYRMYDYPENTKHMHTIYTMLDQRRMLYNCLLGRPCLVNALYKEPEKYVFIKVAYIQLAGEGAEVFGIQ